MAETETLPLDRITTEGTQARAVLSETIISEYAEALRAGDMFPPIDVYFDGTGYWLADGFHRIRATARAGHDTIEVMVHQGGKREAILHAVSANETHGHRRTDADRRHAVLLMLTDSEWGAWSDREIARQCHVSHMLVNRVRREITPREEKRAPEEPRKVKRGGNVYTMHTGRIGAAKKKGTPRTVPTSQPEPQVPAVRPELPALSDGPSETPSVTVLQIDPAASAMAVSQEPIVPPQEPTEEFSAPEPQREPSADRPDEVMERVEMAVVDEQATSPPVSLAHAWDVATPEEQQSFVAQYRDVLQALLSALSSPDNTPVQPKKRVPTGRATPQQRKQSRQRVPAKNPR